MSLSLELRKEISYLRGKVCKRIIKAASINDTWSMKRYSAINSYFAGLMAVKTCSKAISVHSLRYGKSPCLLQRRLILRTNRPLRTRDLPTNRNGFEFVCDFSGNNLFRKRKYLLV